jgi:hypothetical protein
MEFGLVAALAFTRTEAHAMKGETKEHWTQLCELAAAEKDPEKLLALVKEINRMLEEKENHLQQRLEEKA